MNLLRSHGSPTNYLHSKGCKCACCRAAWAEYMRRWWRESPNRKRLARYDDLTYKAQARARTKAWQQANPEKLRAMNATRNPQKVRESNDAWAAAHPNESAAIRRAWHARRRARECGAGEGCSSADIQTQYERQRGCCFWCHEKVGNDYHVDHVMPLALGGSNSKENIVIACPVCNRSKAAKHPMDFAGVML